MAKTSLRAYDREIESLIEQNQFEQAIAHAKHILKFYPKHILTYRLLGKAYLESQRYGDASDVFQRVLSAIPDDFVSHVGMSIIREDEGNLDVAIWHMERAFEIQPANSAIQGELRRLYGKRDGVEPPKVRLTRGALARMYMKGELYQQAIAELRAALAEDPQRPDLLAMLAPAYFLTGQRVEAADTCSTLLKKAPYCLEANRILAEILVNTERTQEAQLCRQRVHALDPYAAQISPAAPSPEKVADNAVSLERLVWSPGQPIAGLPGQPEWASSLGLDLGEQPMEQEGKPEWLADQAAKTSAFVEESPTPENAPPFDESQELAQTEILPSQEDQIPEWMKTAGWGPSVNEAEEPPAVIDDTGIILPDEDEIEQAEIPEWLQAIAPPQPTPEGELPEQSETVPEEEILPSESEALSWLEETPPGPTDSVVTWLEEQQPEAPEIPQAESEIEEAGEMPDWLKDLGPAEPATPKAAEAEGIDEATLAQDQMGTRELPSWLAAGSQSEEETPEEELPDWLKTGLSQAGDEPEPEQPDWLKEAKEEAMQPADEAEPQAEEPAVEEQPAATSSEDEAFAWLESLAAKQGAEEALLLTPEERREEPPEWILEAARAEAGPAIPSELPEEETAIPEWLQEKEQPAEAPPESIEAGETVVPEWLSEFESLATEEELPGPEAVADVGGEQGFEVSEFTAVTPTEQPFTSEEELPEPAAGELPDWLREIPETPAAEIETVETGIPPVFEEAIESPAQELPEPEIEPAEEISAAGISELPDWLQEISEEPAEELPATLEGERVEEELPGEPIAALEGELPSWLMEPEEPVAPTAGISEPGPFEELPAWLTQAEEEPPMEMLFGPQIMTEVEAAPDEVPPPAEEAHEPISDTQPTRVQPSVSIPEPPEPELPLPVTTPLSREVPDWVKELDREEELAKGVELPPAEESQAPTEEEAAFAWLEGLASRMGADEALLLSPEERTEEPPEWITKAAEEAGELPAESVEPWQFTPIEPAIPEESISEQPIEQAAISEPGEELPVEELPPAMTFEQPVPSEEEWVPMESELGAPAEALAEEIGAPTMEEPLESLELESEAKMVEAEIPAEGEALPEVFEPAPALIVDEVKPPAEQELPPELPSWLADVDQVETTREEEEWLPPEEAQLEAAVAAELGAESIEPVEAEVVQLDVNQAGLADLERLPGVGFTRAQAVLAYRQDYGPLSNLDELVNVPGFDSSLVDSLRDQLTTGEVVPVEQIAEGMDADQVTLIQARNALAQGESTQALAHYLSLIKSKQLLPDVIQDLNEALYRFPVDISIWEALGDAHMRSGRLQDALDAYTKAEELIR